MKEIYFLKLIFVKQKMERKKIKKEKNYAKKIRNKYGEKTEKSSKNVTHRQNLPIIYRLILLLLLLLSLSLLLLLKTFQLWTNRMTQT